MASVQGEGATWPHSVAGGVAGSVTVLFLHPFDVIKTRLQVQDGHQRQQPAYQGALDAIKRTYQREGWRAFYNGLVPAWVGSGVAWSAYFTAYESIKGVHQRWQGVDRLSTQWHTISAAQAGATVCLLTNPVWLIKTRMQLQQHLPEAPTAAGVAGGALNSAAQAQSLVGSAGSSGGGAGSSSGSSSGGASSSNSSSNSSSTSSIRGAAGRAASGAGASTSSSSASLGGGSGGRGGIVQRGPTLAAAGGSEPRQYKGVVDAVLRIGREEGLRGYYKGLGPSLVLQTTHGAAQFTVYEELKHMAARSGLAPSEPDRPISSLQTTVFAAASKLAASITTYPSQVVRSRLQQQNEGRTLRYTSSWQVVRLTWLNEGVHGFYKGLGPALLRVMPQSAVTLVVYEKVLAVLKAS